MHTKSLQSAYDEKEKQIPSFWLATCTNRMDETIYLVRLERESLMYVWKTREDERLPNKFIKELKAENKWAGVKNRMFAAESRMKKLNVCESENGREMWIA